eukprot:COSAG01_NODE_392_length_17668_cov_5.382264_4_plen_95_part_00
MTATGLSMQRNFPMSTMRVCVDGEQGVPSWNRCILTEIYLCHACSDHEIEDGNARTGEPYRAPDNAVYKGIMLSRVPNFAFTVGYTNASWTLKA